MGSLFCLVKLVLTSSSYYIFLMLKVETKHLLKVHNHRLVIDKPEHIGAEGSLKLGVLI